MQNVLLVIDSLRPGGAERQFVEVANRLSREKFRVSVCLTARGGALYDKLHVRELEAVYQLEKNSKWEILSLRKELQKILRQAKPDLVHSWLPYSSFLLSLLDLSVPWVTGVRVSPKIYGSTLVGRGVRWLTFDRPQKKSDVVVCNSQNVLEELAQSGYPREKLLFIPNGYQKSPQIQATQQGSDREKVWEGGAPLLVSVGRLEEQKGFTYLLQAVSRLRERFPRLRLMIAGEGGQRQVLEEMVQRQNLQQHVFLLGFRLDVPRLLERADIFVLPSLYEGMPNAVMEAMGHHKAIVATQIEGISELICHGQHGWLIPPKESGLLAEAIAKLWEDKELHQRLASAAGERIKQFCFSQVVSKYQELYHNLIGTTNNNKEK